MANSIGTDPFLFALRHYQTNGEAEGRMPNQFFDVGYYLVNNPDVAAAGVSPLDHYMKFGRLEGRDPSAAFDTTAYLSAHPDVAAAGFDPLMHYLRFGMEEGRAIFRAGSDNQPAPGPGPTIVFVDRPVPGPTVVVEDTQRTSSFSALPDPFDTPAGTFFFGDKTTPANGNVTTFDPDTGTFLALAIAPRQAAGDGSGKFLAKNVVTDGDSIDAFTVIPSGTQSTTKGSFGDNMNRGATNFIYTIGDEGGVAASLAAGNKITLGVDQDGSAGVNFRFFDLVAQGDGTFDFIDRLTGNTAISDNAGNALVVNNSQQVNFFLLNGVANLVPGAQFDVTLFATDSSGDLIASVTQHLQLSQPNLDGTLLIA
jgi:hypothetical protein